MELFEKVYGCYYQVIRCLLEEGTKKPLAKGEMDEFIRKHGFLESSLFLLPRLTDNRWPLFDKTENGLFVSRLKNPAKQPLTLLQKSWLKALLSDARIKLFFKDQELTLLMASLEETAPLFNWEDFHYFDRCQDGDDYSSPQYREHFQTILTALSENKPLIVSYKGRQKDPLILEAAPCQLQYSSKDDKFRLLCLEHYKNQFSREMVLNLSRINACHLSRKQAPEDLKQKWFEKERKMPEPVVIEISGERNSLERCMLHFARYEKQTEYDSEKQVYISSIYYDPADETELLIDILSFGPVIRVLGPEPFLELVRDRVKRQHDLFYGTF